MILREFRLEYYGTLYISIRVCWVERWKHNRDGSILIAAGWRYYILYIYYIARYTAGAAG